jgi:hypothetical protein
MAIPGQLTLEPFDPVTQVITLEGAIDKDSDPPYLILKDKPVDTFPAGGVLRITETTEYAIGVAQNNTTIAAIFAGEIGGDGIYEDLESNPAIVSHYIATLESANLLAPKTQYNGRHSFVTDNDDFEPGQLQDFEDELLKIAYSSRIEEVSITVEASDGTNEIVEVSVSASQYRVNNEEALAQIYRDFYRPIQKGKVEIDTDL